VLRWRFTVSGADHQRLRDLGVARAARRHAGDLHLARPKAGGLEQVRALEREPRRARGGVRHRRQRLRAVEERHLALVELGLCAITVVRRHAPPSADS
jgi:hypothetical protein